MFYKKAFQEVMLQRRISKRASSIDPLTQREMLQSGIPFTWHLDPRIRKKRLSLRERKLTQAELDYLKFEKDLHKNYSR